MPWDVSSVMDERVAFIVAWQSGEGTVSELSRQFQISRKNAYKTIDRFETMGWDGLRDLSRAPHHHPNAVHAAAVESVLAVRQRHPTWGPKKIRAWLREKHPRERWPAQSTIGEILERCGLVKHRRRQLDVAPTGGQLAPIGGPTEVWAAGFKGLVPHRRRAALRALLAERPGEPLCAAPAGPGADRAGARLGIAGCGVPRVRLADPPAQRQWAALCQHGAGRLVGAGGTTDQGRGYARADRAGSSAAERAARAPASDGEGRHRHPAGRHDAPAATALRRVLPHLQRGAAARSARPEAAGGALCRIAAPLQRPVARARISHLF